MGTLVEIFVIEKDEKLAITAIQEAFREIRRLEKLMSIHIPDSEISKKSGGRKRSRPSF